MISVPDSFRAQPRWSWDGAGRAWLQELPQAVAEQCRLWDLELDGAPMHGSNALVVPVRRHGDPLALRLAPPGDDVHRLVQDLRLWKGRGTVALEDTDLARRAVLLERLDGGLSLDDVPLEEAVEVLAGLVRRLAVPVPADADVPSTREEAQDAAEGFPTGWERTGRPIPRRLTERVVRHAVLLAERDPGDGAVDGDLHFEQVLAGTREPWLVVDPVLLRGDPEYDLGRILWSRFDEIEDEAATVRLFERFVEISGVPADRARSWVVTRAGSYLIWGLQHGLTDDPPTCVRLLEIFA